MTVDAQRVIADVLRKHGYRLGRRGGPLDQVWYTACSGCDWIADGLDESAHLAHQAAEVVAALGGLTREEQWTPVQKDGHRWEPRDEALAESALALYGPGGPLDFDDTSPIVEIEHHARWVGGWIPKGAE